MTDSTLNNYISRGTNAERVAFTPSPPTPGSGNHPSYIFHETDTGDTFMWSGAAWQQVNNASGSVTTTGSPASGNLAKFSGTSSVTNGDLSGDVTTSGGLAVTLAASGVTAGTYGDSTHSLTATVDAKGRVTAISANAVSAGAMTLISEQTPTGTTATFSSIPGTYRSLRLIWTARTDNAATSDTFTIQFNGDTGANYDRQLISGAGSSATASESLAQTSAALANVSAATAPSGAAGSGEAVFPSYADTTFQKTAISHYTFRSGMASASVVMRSLAVDWRSTAAISSIVLTATGNFVTGSKFQLYGVS